MTEINYDFLPLIDCRYLGHNQEVCDFENECKCSIPSPKFSGDFTCSVLKNEDCPHFFEMEKKFEQWMTLPICRVCKEPNCEKPCDVLKEEKGF